MAFVGLTCCYTKRPLDIEPVVTINQVGVEDDQYQAQNKSELHDDDLHHAVSCTNVAAGDPPASNLHASPNTGGDATVSEPKNPSKDHHAVQKFEVTMEKGQHLGMDVKISKDHKVVVVQKITDGSICDWNNAKMAEGNGSLVVCRGDRIVEVNGCGRGDGAAMLKTLNSASGTVTMKIMRLNEFMVTHLDNFPRDHLGLEFAEDDSGNLVITKVGSAANHSLQADVELRPGDLIVKVNGNTEMLKAEIASHDSLTLRVRRSSSSK